MPSYPSNVNPGWFLPTTEIIGTDLIIEAAKDNVLLQQVLIQVIKSIGNLNKTVNGKDTGIYSFTEFINSQGYYISSNSSQPISVFRKLINFGALPDTGNKPVAHNIPINANQDFTFTRIYGVATDPVNFVYLPLPYASPTPANNIELQVTDTNISITTGSNRTAFTRCYVVVEYLKNL